MMFQTRTTAGILSTAIQVCGFLLISGQAAAEDAIDFRRQVEPLLQEHCIRCHGAEEQSSGLRLDQRGSVLRGGDEGEPTIVPGKPEESFLLAVLDPDSTQRMPPEGDPLTKDQIDVFRQWILQGATWPGQMEISEDRMDSDHWSLQSIETTIRPPHDNNNPIDAFIDDRLSQIGLKRSLPADPATQLRRLSFVLTGLPPSPEQVAALTSRGPEFESGYADAVEQMLESPRYGERWAQHWLDVIRWAETVGFETNLARPKAWPYRDWVIDALNEDKPYNQFLFEQLAGDTIGVDAALGFLVAGPANLPGQVGRDEEAMRQARQDELDEVIRTVGQGFLGLTIGCARCHNHKFDPILQQDYFAMQAIFAGLSYGERRWRGDQNDKWTKKLPAADKKLQALIDERESLRHQLRLRTPTEQQHSESFQPMLASAIRLTIEATHNRGAASLYELRAWTPDSPDAPSRNVALATSGGKPSASSFALSNQTRHHDNLVDGSVDRRQAFPWVAASAGPAWIQVDFKKPTRIARVDWDRGSSTPVGYRLELLSSADDSWREIANAQDRFPREDDLRSADQISLTGIDPAHIGQIVVLSEKLRQARSEAERLRRGPQVFAARFDTSPDPTWQLRRGDPMQRVREVAPAIPLVLGDLQLDINTPENERRTALAKHLTSNDHPLTARVIVNRVWQHHFGNGLVDTPSDFGLMGSKPTHPQLLDWLTHQFILDGWSLKRLHRRIVTSETFRQSNRPREKAIAVDSESRFLWRFPPRRMEAEAIRDSILQASGKLNLQAGGPGFDLFRQRGGLSGFTAHETFGEAGWRRMIYAHKIRMQAVDIFGAFDCPDAGQMKPKRTQSITPTQCLSLLNSPFIQRQAEFFAERVRSESGDEIDGQITLAFELAFSRPPMPAEQEQMRLLVQQAGLTQLCRVLFNTSEFLYIP